MMAGMLAIGALGGANTIAAQTPSPAMFDHVAESRMVIEALGAGKFTEVEARYDPEMLQALPAGQLAVAWAQITTQAGKLTELGEPRVEDREGMRLVIFPATYERAPLNLILAWTAEHKLGALLAQPRSSGRETVVPGNRVAIVRRESTEPSRR
jgi:hypothetical protein